MTMILKKPDMLPEIVNITANDIVKLFNPGGAYAGIPHDDYSSQITMYYRDGKFNFEVCFHKYYGDVLLVKSKYHHKCTNSNLCDMSDDDITRLYAAMKWLDTTEGERECTMI